jgi:hypothetical protein
MLLLPCRQADVNYCIVLNEGEICTPERPCGLFFSCTEFQRVAIGKGGSPTSCVNPKLFKLLPSTIPNGGFGLFNSNIRKFYSRSIISAYGTHFYNSETCRSSAYTFKKLCGCDVPACPPNDNKQYWFSKYAYGSFPNDPMCDECVNARIISCPVHAYAAYVVCTKQISTGDEVFISYGAQFWNSLIDPSNPNKGTRRNNVDTTYSGYCDKHAQSVFCEDVDELYK